MSISECYLDNSATTKPCKKAVETGNIGNVYTGMNGGTVELNGQVFPFDMVFVAERICMPMVKVIIAMICGRFLWRICFFGSAVRLEEDIRNRA